MKNEKILKCSLCLKNFNAIIINNNLLKIKIRESDFHIIYNDYSPLLYEAIVCSNCGFAGLKEKFESITPFEEKILRNLFSKKKILPFPKINNFLERNYEDAEIAFNQAISWAKVLKISSYKIAGLILRNAWLCREQKKEREEKIYLEQAVEYYEKAYSYEGVVSSSLGEPGAAYLAGEMYRRLGNNKKANIWFNSAIKLHNIKKNPLINELAKQQLNIINSINKEND